METVGQRIRKLREIKAEEVGHCTQEELGKDLGVTQNTVQKWEHDMVCLNAAKIVELADYFDVSTDYILRGGKPEHLKMMESTGLSDRVISFLTGDKHFNDSKLAKTLNELAEHPNLLYALHEYFFADLSKIKINGEYVQTNSITFSDLWQLKNLDDFEPLVRMTVMEHLRVTRGLIKDGKS